MIWILLALMALTAVEVQAKANSSKHPNKGLLFFYRNSQKIDRFLLQGIDTNYITLPEHSWRLALTVSTIGVNSQYTNYSPSIGTIHILSRTTPSASLGFNAGYRGFGGGYSWDLMNAYTRNLNFSIGSKRFGLEYMRQVSTNLNGSIYSQDEKASLDFGKGWLWITHTYLNAWYALNAAHYSHNAAIKQSYIQKRTAGSLLLSLSYMSSDLMVNDTISVDGIPLFALLTDRVKQMITHQVAVGLGYGINYTPNNGKVLLHLAANAQLVCYSIDQISLALPDSLDIPGNPYYNILPNIPVHVTGNMRAAVSWEINKWVHLSFWAQANNIRFTSHAEEMNVLKISNWNWQTHLSIGVRFGAGKDRINRALQFDGLSPKPQEVQANELPRTKLPQWVTDFFFSPRL